MEWVASALSAVVSGCVVGLAMLLFTNKFDKTVKDAEKVNTLTFGGIDKRFQDIEKKIDSLDTKTISVAKEVSTIITKIAVVATEQKHATENISNLREEIKDYSKKFGKVILKD